MERETNNLLNKMAPGWTAFNDRVIGYPVPAQPSLLSFERQAFRVKFMDEEDNEMHKAYIAGDLEGVVDALIDSLYVRIGALGEMGVLVQPVWDEVQRANMSKERGQLSKRPGAQGFDAIKPEGWKGPSHADYLTITSDEARMILDHRNRPEPFEDILARVRSDVPVGCIRKPRILVLGYGRHGKDTVCELLRDKYGFKFTSSSWFCAERVLMPTFTSNRYRTVQECFDDRANWRKHWYGHISAYNWPDASRLGREIFAENDIYCGLRSAREFHALRNTEAYDIAIWVDAKERVEPESQESCTVEPWMADYVLDNNGTPEDLAFNLDQLMTHLDLWQE